MDRLRPEVKPEHVSDSEWENSKCDKSPTGSHWFVSRSSNVFRCYFCEKSHTVVWGTGQKPEKDKTLDKLGRKPGRPGKKLGRPSKHS